MPYRTLGSTGEKVSVIGLGGYHTGLQSDEDDSITLIRTAVDRGINFMDNCWDYNGGESEIRMGKALRDGYRDKVFLMSKIDGRTKEAAAKQIDESLKRLQTDRVDLMQFHEIIRMEDPEKIFARGRRDGGDAGGEKRPARCVTSVSPGTRTRRCISKCCRSPMKTNFTSTRCKCR